MQKSVKRNIKQQKSSWGKVYLLIIFSVYYLLFLIFMMNNIVFPPGGNPDVLNHFSCSLLSSSSLLNLNAVLQFAPTTQPFSLRVVHSALGVGVLILVQIKRQGEVRGLNRSWNKYFPGSHLKRRMPWLRWPDANIFLFVKIFKFPQPFVLS